MILIVGLGNPGKKFEKTRHNLGFRIIDEFARNYKFPDFKLSRLRQGFGLRPTKWPSADEVGGQAKKSNILISESFLNEEKIILAKPQTFMNNSGKSVKLLTKPYTLDPKNLIIVHDDLDLPLGKIKIVRNRGSAGHKGVQSIIDELKTKDFVRFRIGIRPKDPTFYAAVQNVDTFVLQKFNKKEGGILKEVIKRTVEAIETALREGVESAMSKFNK